MMAAMATLRITHRVFVPTARFSSAASAYASAAGPPASALGGSGSRSNTNWLEANCGDVPTQPRQQDDEISEMLRGGHAIQLANKALLDAKLTSGSRRGATAYDPAHLAQLQELQQLEQRAVERIEHAVAHDGVRFRPSLLLPLVHCSSTLVGGVLSLFGERVSTSYETGVKVAISDYYNDQIRELYAHKPHELALKDLFKATRDEELEFVDAHAPDTIDTSQKPAEHDSVTTFAKASSKILLQVAKAV